LEAADPQIDRPPSVTAVGGVSPYLVSPESARRRRSRSYDNVSGTAGQRISLFGGRAPSGSSSVEQAEGQRSSVISYPGQPFVDERTYLRAMGLTNSDPGHGNDNQPASDEGGSIPTRSAWGLRARGGPPLSAVRSRMASDSSFRGYDEFGQSLKYGIGAGARSVSALGT
jgi:hypothetical protein